jgi:hypothetical protein
MHSIIRVPAACQCRETHPGGSRCNIGLLFELLLLFSVGVCQANAQVKSLQPSENVVAAEDRVELVTKIDELMEQNQKLNVDRERLEEQNRQLLDEIRQIRNRLAGGQPQTEQRVTSPSSDGQPQPSSAGVVSEQQLAVVSKSEDAAGEGKPQELQPAEQKKKWGTYTPNLGFKVANTENGDLNVSIYSYARYLNQLGLDSTYTNAFGKTTTLQRRQDFQLQKLQVKFLGWVMDPKLRYFLYGWTSNANQGQGAQVVLAGNLNYSFSKLFTLGAGIYSLPGTRSVEGNFPFWPSVDSRQIADEFFRPSYTSGIIVRGDITDKLRYQTMLGNNMSTLGVSAQQLDNGLNTFSGALVWTPTTGEFGPGWGDFEDHQKVATRFAGHFTRSNETKESQSPSEEFENTQIRLEDGSIIFTPNLFGPGITVNEVTNRMMAVDGGIKYRGFALEGEYYLRWRSDFKATNTAGLPGVFDHGFQLQTAAMVVPKTLQAYLGGSTVFGKYGNPYDVRFGLNWFPWKNKVVRWNNEALYLSNSPVGYTSVPFAVGGKGFVFHSSWELAF